MKTLGECIANLQALKGNLKKIAANEMVNYALDNLKKGTDIRGQRFKERKPGTKRNTGRAILFDTGDGRRSIKGRETSNGAELTGLVYMLAHNEGVNKTVSGRSRLGNSFTRKMDLPQREFAGDSPAQRARIESEISKAIIRACR